MYLMNHVLRTVLGKETCINSCGPPFEERTTIKSGEFYKWGN
jgi:hypothetical protein